MAGPGASDTVSHLTGVVYSPDGTPKREASVRFVFDDRGQREIVSGRTDPAGRFSLSVPGPEVSGALLGCSLDLAYRSTAIEGISSRTPDVELWLGEPRYLRVDVRDPEGIPIERAGAMFAWSIAGFELRDWRPGWGKIGEPLTWELPSTPFFVTAQARGHRQMTLGPLEPQEVGRELRIRLQRLPRLRGRVTHDGEPVVGASVSSRRESPPRGLSLNDAGPNLGWWQRFAVTDAMGEFDEAWHQEGDFEFRAWSDALGEGTFGAVSLDLDSKPANLKIEIVRAPGTVRGTVLLPPRGKVHQIWLMTSKSPGYRSLAPDGSFVLPDLPSGRDTIRMLKRLEVPRRSTDAPADHDEWVQISDGPTRAPDWLAIEPTWDVEVVSGRTVEVDLDLTAPMPCRLEGQVLLNGRPPPPVPRLRRLMSEGPPRAALDRGDEYDYVSRTELGSGGSFTLQAQPGTYRLRIEVPTSRESHWIVHDRLELGIGVHRWELEVSTGSLHVLPRESDGKVLPFSGTARWRGGGELRVFPKARRDERTRTVVYPFVPAGRVELVDRDSTVHEVQVSARGTTTFRIPADGADQTEAGSD